MTQTAPPPRRPWWKRKRTWVAFALWLSLPVFYAASEGPAKYCNGRDWIHDSIVDRIYGPLWPVKRRLPDPIYDAYNRWVSYCFALGLTHELEARFPQYVGRDAARLK